MHEKYTKLYEVISEAQIKHQAGDLKATQKYLIDAQEILMDIFLSIQVSDVPKKKFTLKGG
jgi:hypothetical protein